MIKRVQELKTIAVLDKNHQDVRRLEMIDPPSKVQLPMFIEDAGETIQGMLHVDRYYLTLFDDTLVYLHEDAGK